MDRGWSSIRAFGSVLMRRVLTGKRDAVFSKHVGRHMAELQFFCDGGMWGRCIPEAWLVMVPRWQDECDSGASSVDRKNERIVRYEGDRAIQALNEAQMSGWERVK